MYLLQEAKALEVLRLGVLEILQYTNAFPVTLGRLRSLELREGDPTLVYAFLRDLIAPNLHNISIWLPLDYTLSGSTAGNILLSFVSSSYASRLTYLFLIHSAVPFASRIRINRIQKMAPGQAIYLAGWILILPL